MRHPFASLTQARSLALVTAVGMSACSNDEPAPGGDAGRASSDAGGVGTSSNGGTSAGASFGGAGASVTGGATTGGSTSIAGSAGSAGRGQGAGTNSGGASAAGAASAGAPSGGTSASAGRGGTSAGGSGGAVSTSGTGGAPGGAGMGDRCDVANLTTGDAPEALSLTGNLGTHDPVVIFAHERYYLFHTGNGVGAKTSTNLREWKAAPAVFSTNPSWIAEQVPGATNLWAPDISYFGGSYHLYYSASTFGSNRSCIGHATRAALDAGTWTDHGSVVCSNPGGGSKDDWNAIDPNVIVDGDGTPWLSFGSFWGGLKLMKLDQTGARADTELHSIAARPSNGGALEAPFIVRRCGYYYLFVSFDTCCKGADSTYKTMVGRSTSVTGPYTDAQGVAMLRGGGTLVLQGGTRWRGPGHNAVLFTETAAFNVYHSYDADNNGNSVLRISELAWDAEGWPVSGGP